jgi:hypothetical protein
MGYDVGAGGAFGIFLPDATDPAVKRLYKAFTARVGKLVGDYHADAEGRDSDLPDDPDELREIAAQEFLGRFVAAFRKAGVEVPDGARLIWTGSEDDRPGRTDCPADEWVLGWGLFTEPHRYPPMADSFKAVAGWHTWACGG